MYAFDYDFIMTLKNHRLNINKKIKTLHAAIYI